MPCWPAWFSEWHRLYQMGYIETNAYAVEADDSGNVYVSGVARDETNTVRILLKYDPSGDPVPSYDIPGFPEIPFYFGVSSREDWEYLPWHKVVIDNNRNRVYVLFAGQHPGELHYHFFLACHDIDSGDKVSTWNSGYNIYVGDSAVLNGGLDIDSDGNAWTALNEMPGYLYGIRIKKWSVNDGSNITPQSNIDPATDYFVIAAQNKKKSLQAFGIRKNDDKIYVAYYEEGYPESYDLVVTIWEKDLQFIDRVEYSWEIPPPLPGVPQELWNAPSTHPHFTDGLVDGDGSFIVCGSYAFFALEWEFIVMYAYPIAVKHSVSATGDSLVKNYEYFPNDYPDNNFTVDAPCDPQKVVIARGPGNPESVYLMMILDEDLFGYTGVGVTHHWSYRRIDGAGQFVEVCSLTVPFATHGYDPPGSGCYNFWEVYAKDFTYIHGRIIRSGRTIKRLLRDMSSSGCPQEPAKAFTASYTRWLRFIVIPVLWEFEFFFQRDPTWWWWSEFFSIPPPDASLPPRPSFSAISRKKKVPPHLRTAYREVIRLHSTHGRLEFPRKAVKRLIRVFKDLPLGFNYTEELQGSVFEVLNEFGDKQKLEPSISAVLLEALNSADIDWRSPTLQPMKVKKGENVVIDIEGVARLIFSEVVKAGECKLEIKPGLPALAKGMIPGWPVVTYHFDFSGDLSKASHVTLNFYIGGTKFERGTLPVLLQWNGKEFKNITTNIHQRRGVITGKTNRLSTFVILGATSECMEKEPVKK